MSTIIASRKILIVPLDWGLGHATRDIPLIREMLNAGCQVFIAAEGKHAALLQQEFPQLTILPLPGYRIQYAQKGQFFGLKIIQQIPKIFRAINYEQRWLKKIVAEYQINAVISDNRFGLYHKNIPTVFITHQLLIKTPFGGWIERTLQKINYRFINKYSACWIPDFPGSNNLSGELAHPGQLPAHTTYIGCLSRFEPKPGVEKKYDLLVLISGPEPQRSNLEKLILDQVKSLSITALIVSGKPGTPQHEQVAPGVTQINHLNASELNEAMLASDMVLSRSGYTTLMDLAKLNKKAILIPTPGQSEQVYLGEYLMEKGYFYSLPQERFHLKTALDEASRFPFRSFHHEQDMNQYKQVVQQFVQSL
ncbi:UDP:flavonoid glycosyltransferase YjiC, YdhE family [Chitinophaga ginsengisegetis]|uniref:UDP:flavonoid glycosyltransferase YjiC, YdhE family n=1 Tax=Chitinophaga ginsengisegetis TaxID=393003 RepID=A0A1T5P6F3_9BACT|nr:glycosyltransferase [Chitinophaga ginsengisegetis]MDR6566169.1 UDP:flavonoid glycosyltransferase YjiC (YdhE family) [Chitinophaga ginsengisegetis]MDR6645899.1 UDP:flavonoid glycosyltransferase YjiC (YdhE family) [Chitinophaga ginsengisegetis]MDR6651509.1 UDP:flavonoid glycosyltransferase YjiC (YdhE family) [Chitinophaga ginsengisegetis]SKD08291.1 UDP:flavonoid glycosyltransferase YjiC, YdhE family [Chitinophaga ginsengisegetis]